jgi:nicotinamide-nucleotide amidase
MASMPPSDAMLERLAALVGRELLASDQRVATAESCTGGWIAKALTDVAGSSQWFEDGVVAYSNLAKQRRLGVGRKLLDMEGAVSEAVVRAMAAGVLHRSAATVAVAVSGIAGPGGAVPGKPVGSVWLCWARRGARGVSYASELHHFRGNREMVRRKTVLRALRGLRRQ